MLRSVSVARYKGFHRSGNSQERKKKCKVGKLAYSEKSRLEIDIRRKVGENIVTATVRGAGGCSVTCTVKSEKFYLVCDVCVNHGYPPVNVYNYEGSSPPSSVFHVIA